MLNLNQLRAFYEVARSLSFSIAAERLSVTQPAVSKQIKCLEEFYDLKLFLIKRKKVFLTDEGRKLFVYASRIFELERQLEEMMSGVMNLQHGSLRIATTKTYAKVAIPTLLRPFQEKFPNVIVELNEGSSLNITKSLLDFKNSLAIGAKVEIHPDIVFTPLLLEEIVLIAAPDYRILKKNSISFNNLKREPIVMKEFGSGTRKLVDDYFSQVKIRPNIIAQSSNMEFIKEMVKRKKGVAFVVKSAVDQELSQGELVSVPLDCSPLFLDIFISYLKDYDLPHAAKNFLAYFLPVANQDRLPVGFREIIERINAD